MTLLITTTGLLSPVPIDDLAALELIHPIVYDATVDFPLAELRLSGDLQTSITAGEVTVTYNGNPVTNLISDIPEPADPTQIVSATTENEGLVELATQAEADAGTPADRVITADTLQNSALATQVGTNTTDITNLQTDSHVAASAGDDSISVNAGLQTVKVQLDTSTGGGNSILSLTPGQGLYVPPAATVPNATESVAGIAELATQGETDTGTDDARIVTPLKLANSSLASDVAANTAKVSADGSVTTHSDVTNAGSGQIITNAERADLHVAVTVTDDSLTLAGQALNVNLDTVTGGGNNALVLTGGQGLYVPPATVPDATESVKGIVELATQAETNAGALDTVVITPLKLQNATNVVHRTGNETVAGIKSFTDRMVVDDQGFATPYELSVQGSTAFTYIEILNTAQAGLGGANKGAFFGIEDNGPTAAQQSFALYNWQGGSIDFWTDTVASSGNVRFSILPNGNVQVHNLGTGYVQSNASGILSSSPLPIASTTVQGIIEIATQGEVDTGSSTTLALTPSTFANSSIITTLQGASHNALTLGGVPSDTTDDTLNLTAGQVLTVNLATPSSDGAFSAADKTKLDAITGTNTGDEIQATENIVGIVELATQGEVDAGTDTSRVVTPATLANFSGFNNYTHPNHTGDVTSVGDGAQTIAADVVDNSKLSNMAANTIKSRAASSAGDPGDLLIGNGNIPFRPTGGNLQSGTPAQIRTLLNVEDGATAEVQATESIAGIAELATQGEVNGGVDDQRIITPLKLLNAANVVHTLGNESIAGLKSFTDAIPLGFTFAGAPDALGIGYVSDGTTDRWSIFKAGTAGDLGFMPNSPAPIMYMGNDAASAALIEGNNSAPILLNAISGGPVTLSSGTLTKTGFGAGFLQSDAGGVITSGALPTATTGTPGLIAIATQAEVNAGTVVDKAVTPETLDAATNVVHRSGNETIGGVKTFTENSIFIDPAATTNTLEIGYFTDVTPNCYGIRGSTASGYFCFMPNATNPQIVLGDPANVTGEAYIDVDNNRRLNLNVLDTGAGTPAEVRIGSGGLTVLAFGDGWLQANGSGVVTSAARYLTDSWAYSVSNNQATVSATIALRRQNGTFTNQNPYTVLRDATIVGVTAESGSTNQWTFDIRVNGLSVHTEVKTNGQNRVQNPNLSINVNANDSIEMYYLHNGTNTARPGGTVHLRAR